MAELVYGLSRKHRIGTICGNPCRQCRGQKVAMTGPGDTGSIDPMPLYIVREATYEEYVSSAIAHGGGKDHLSKPSDRNHYYVVHVD